MRQRDLRRADALFAGFALALLLVIVSYRYGWQSFRHTIPPDKLAIDIENSASTAATLALVLELFGSGRVTTNYVRTAGEDANQRVREEWSHARERRAPGASGSRLASYRSVLGSLDTVTAGIAAPSFERGRAVAAQARLAAIDSTLRGLAR